MMVTRGSIGMEIRNLIVKGKKLAKVKIFNWKDFRNWDSWIVNLWLEGLALWNEFFSFLWKQICNFSYFYGWIILCMYKILVGFENVSNFCHHYSGNSYLYHDSWLEFPSFQLSWGCGSSVADLSSMSISKRDVW